MPESTNPLKSISDRTIQRAVEPVFFSCLHMALCVCITKTRLFKYTENFTTKKMKKFQIKNSFHISVRVPTIYVFDRNQKNNVYPCKPQFYYIKVGFKGVKII